MLPTLVISDIIIQLCVCRVLNMRAHHTRTYTHMHTRMQSTCACAHVQHTAHVRTHTTHTCTCAHTHARTTHSTRACTHAQHTTHTHARTHTQTTPPSAVNFSFQGSLCTKRWATVWATATGWDSSLPIRGTDVQGRNGSRAPGGHLLRRFMENGLGEVQVDLLLIPNGSEDEARARIRLHLTSSPTPKDLPRDRDSGFLASTAGSRPDPDLRGCSCNAYTFVVNSPHWLPIGCHLLTFRAGPFPCFSPTFFLLFFLPGHV